MPSAQYEVIDFAVDNPSVIKNKVANNSLAAARVAGGYQCYANTPAAMNVKLAAGGMLVNGAPVDNAIQTSGTITAPVGNPRIDLVVIDAATGVGSVVTGTPAGSPVAPAVPAGKLPVAEIALATSTTAIGNTLITDRRPSMTAPASGETVGTMKVWPGLGLPDANWGWCDGGALSRSTYPALFAHLMKQATVTLSIASPCVVTWAGHGLRDNHPFKVFTSGGLPTGLTAGTHGSYTGTVYYVKKIDDNTFNLAATPGGANINTSGSQSGTHTGVCAPHGNGDGSTTFHKPDARGRALIGRDDMGGTAANRITSAGSGILGKVPGAVGGAETVTLTTAQLPSHQHPNGGQASIPTYVDSKTPNGNGIKFGSGLGPNDVSGPLTGSTASAGSGAAHPNTQPVLVEDLIIRIQ